MISMHLLFFDLLQEIKQLLEQGQQPVEIKESLLQTIAMQGLHCNSPSGQLLVLAVLVGRLDDLDPGIRSFAAQLLISAQPDLSRLATMLKSCAAYAQHEHGLAKCSN